MGALLTFVTACPGTLPTPTPSPGPGARPETGAIRTPLDPIAACVPGGGWSYHLVEATLLIPSLVRTVDGDRVSTDVRSATITGRFHAPLGCPESIGPNDGATATFTFKVRHAAEIDRTGGAGGGACIQRSRADYRDYTTSGLGAAWVVVDPRIRDEFHRGLDRVALAPTLLDASAAASGRDDPRCADWSELP